MTQKIAQTLVVVTPVYEDVEASRLFFRQLAAEFGSSLYIVAVDDGSVCEPLPLSNLSSVGLPGVILRLKRNVGHQRAIAIGLGYVAERIADDHRIVVMDSDGEDMPHSVNKLVEALDSPDVDVAVAERKSRVETLRFRIFYLIYQFVFGLLTGKRIRFGNFMAMKSAALRRLAITQETWVHVAASVLASKLRIRTCLIDRGPRYAGQSKMNFVGLALHGFRGLMVFAEDVLVRVGIACTVIAGLSVMGVGMAVLLKLFGYATPGWFSVALGIMLLVFLQTGTLTLVTLMLTGVVRGGGVSNLRHQDYILDISYSESVPHSERE